MWVRAAAAAVAICVLGTGIVLARVQLDDPPDGTTAGAAPDTATPVASEPPGATSAAPATAEPAATSTAAAPAPAPPTADPAAGPLTPEQRIHGRLTRILARSRLARNVGLVVLDGQGRPVFGHGASRPLLPASTQKLPVAAAALSRLGTQFRYVTTVKATAVPQPNGVLQGDLVVVGSGDPTLAGPEFALLDPDRPRTRLEALARRIKKAGIRRVTGRIVGDPTIFADEPAAAGWPPRYFDELDTTRISGLTVDKGRRIYRSGGGLRAVPARDPASQTAASLRRLLRTIGVKVEGEAAAVRQPVATTTDVAAIRSPAMGPLLRYMVQRSDNHLADTIFRTMGAADRDPTWVGSAGSVADTLAPLDLDWSGIVLADGSGLSRANRVTPRFLADLQNRMWRSNLADQWAGLLAVSARSGTLRHRLGGSVAAGRVYGKTGSLRDVRALVGTVIGPQGRQVHFASVGNKLTDADADAMSVLTDKAVLAMAEELYECRRVPRGPRNNKRRPPRLVCAAG